MSQRSLSQRGFTLIEVLVSLALMAMIGTILVASLEIGGHTWQRVMRTAGNSEDIAQAQDFLRRHLASLYPQEHAPESSAGSEFLVSDGASIEFSSAAPDSSGDGLWRYHVALSRDSGALEVRSRRDRAGLEALPARWASEDLLPHAQSLVVRFWLKPAELPGRWVDRWVDLTHIPSLIRIDVTFADKDNRRWPSLYIEPRVDTPTSCTFDVVSRRCRSGA
jgi:prepilin-type N-terminal cleavage/methylation domain-containing protein